MENKEYSKNVYKKINSLMYNLFKQRNEIFRETSKWYDYCLGQYTWMEEKNIEMGKKQN